MKKTIFDMGAKMNDLAYLLWLWDAPKKLSDEDRDRSPWTRPLGRPCPEPSDRKLVD